MRLGSINHQKRRTATINSRAMTINITQKVEKKAKEEEKTTKEY